MPDLGELVGDRTSLVRVRQLADRLRHQLSFIPGLYVLGAIVAVQVVLWIDRRLSDDSLPDFFVTTVDSARSVFAVVAGGLITAITLLLSMALITVQLASTQFSPRTLRDWLADRVLQHTVGLALGSTVFALLALRSTRSFGEGEGAVVPHVAVVVAVVLAVGALFMVVRSVDHVANSVRVGAVAQRIAGDTVGAIEADEKLRSGQAPTSAPTTQPDRIGKSGERSVPDGAVAVESPRAGWVQQVDVPSILGCIPDRTTAYVAVPVGSYVSSGAPLLWLEPAPDHDVTSRVLDVFAVGDTRTMQQDVSYGLVQLTDIAVRALSPGVNDPSTAIDIIAHLGSLFTRLWELPASHSEFVDGDRTVVVRSTSHGEHLRRCCEPIRRHGRGDPDVSRALVRMLDAVRSESERRDAPGPIAPFEEMIAAIAATADRTGWSAGEEAEFDELVRAAADSATETAEPNDQ